MIKMQPLLTAFKFYLFGDNRSISPPKKTLLPIKVAFFFALNARKYEVIKTVLGKFDFKGL